MHVPVPTFPLTIVSWMPGDCFDRHRSRALVGQIHHGRSRKSRNTHARYFHTFRHWKATMEYHKTKDNLHVMHLLGHKSITNTHIYTQLISIQDNDYDCKAAKKCKKQLN